MNKISRREALMFAAFAGGSMLLPVVVQHRGYAQRTDERVEPFTLAFRTPPVLNPVRSDSTTDYYEITIQKATVEILPGRTTEIWGYNGTFSGPTIKQRKNRQSVVRFINDVNTPTVVHLHGMASLPQYDGYAILNFSENLQQCDRVTLHLSKVIDCG